MFIQPSFFPSFLALKLIMFCLKYFDDFSVLPFLTLFYTFELIFIILLQLQKSDSPFKAAEVLC
jgi:hypothetical protein